MSNTSISSASIDTFYSWHKTFIVGSHLSFCFNRHGLFLLAISRLVSNKLHIEAWRHAESHYSVARFAVYKFSIFFTEHALSQNFLWHFLHCLSQKYHTEPFSLSLTTKILEFDFSYSLGVLVLKSIRRHVWGTKTRWEIALSDFPTLWLLLAVPYKSFSIVDHIRQTKLAAR